MVSSAITRQLRLNTLKQAVVLNAPDVFRPAIGSFEGGVLTRFSASGFIIVFVRDCRDAEAFLPAVSRIVKSVCILWACSPVKSSNIFQSDINRDKSWDIPAEADFVGVSMLSLDNDWSGLRFGKKGFSRGK